MTPIDWDRGLTELAAQEPGLARWAEVAAAATADELRRVGGGELPLMAVHGDFLGGENVHYAGDRLAGVIDFGVAHRGTRVYDLISARTYRQPDVGRGYVAEMNRLGWPLTDTERGALVPIYRAFRLSMLAWQLDVGMRTGRFDAAAIRSQLSQTVVDRDGQVGRPPVHLPLPH